MLLGYVLVLHTCMLPAPIFPLEKQIFTLPCWNVYWDGFCAFGKLCFTLFPTSEFLNKSLISLYCLSLEILF